MEPLKSFPRTMVPETVGPMVQGSIAKDLSHTGLLRSHEFQSLTVCITRVSMASSHGILQAERKQRAWKPGINWGMLKS